MLGETGELQGYRVRLSYKDQNRKSKFKLCLGGFKEPGACGP